LKEVEDNRRGLDKDKGSLNRKIEMLEEELENKELTINNQTRQLDELRE
jgi:hypothetical protein